MNEENDANDARPPLAGIRVVEFTHMVMGPSIGVILGAEVIKVEPIGGDQTRRRLGSGAGYFPMFNRNKRSICLDLKADEGLAVARALVEHADVMVEDHRPGTIDRLGLGHASLAESNPGLISCSAKGFLTDPYEHSHRVRRGDADDGRPRLHDRPAGRPLRAGSSVVDITGGMFGVIGILAALERRHRTGGWRGARVALRNHRLPRQPAHGAAGGDPEARAADAGARVGLGDLRRVRDAAPR